MFCLQACVTHIWQNMYSLIVFLAIPSSVFLFSNVVIFSYVRSSTNRVQPSSDVTKHNQQQHNNRRDLHLLQHLIVMFCIFVGGWAPINIYAAVTQLDFTQILPSLFILFAQLALLVDLVNLFLYNHELRRFFREKFCR
jgi:hypothetical protein